MGFCGFLDKFYFSWCLQIFGFILFTEQCIQKKLFRHTHKLHHLSTDPTPFATNSVHALEAVMDIGFIVIACFFIPLHPIALFIVLSIAFIWSTIGHLGYEILPKKIIFYWKIFKFTHLS